MKLVYVTAITLLAAACAAAAVDPVNQPAVPAPAQPAWAEGREGGGVPSCSPQALNYLEGQRASEIDMGSLPHPLRVIRPGASVTMDYVEGRTNLELDAQGRVVRIYCG